MIAASNVAASATYEDIERMLFKVCGNFENKFGGNIDDYLSIASWTFMRAYQKFDATRGNQFTTYIWWALWNNLTKFCVGKKMDRMTVNTTDYLGDIDLNVLPSSPGFNLRELLFEVSEDSRLMLGLLLDTPELLRSKSEKPTDLKRGLIEYLRQSLGWTAARVAESFSEIREALG